MRYFTPKNFMKFYVTKRNSQKAKVRRKCSTYTWRRNARSKLETITVNRSRKGLTESGSLRKNHKSCDKCSLCYGKGMTQFLFQSSKVKVTSYVKCRVETVASDSKKSNNAQIWRIFLPEIHVRCSEIFWLKVKGHDHRQHRTQTQNRQ